MAIAAAASTDLPQYLGELFQKGKRPNAVLRLIGGLTGGVKNVNATTFPMGVDYSLDAGSQPGILEGADPTSAQVAATQASNVVQIFQEAFEFTYSRLGATAAIDGITLIPGAPAGGAQLQIPGSFSFQAARAAEQIANDANYTFLRGTYVLPTDNDSARKCRGMLTAVSTNDANGSGTNRALTKTIFEGALKTFMANGMFNKGDEITVIGDADQVENLTDLYKSDTQLPESRAVAGVMVETIITTWAICNVVYDPDMASNELFLFRPELCAVVAMPIPGKGIIFAEPLAKTGSTEKSQMYAELGIDYVNEIFVGSIDDLST